jgi:hypothetical protein
MRWFRAPLTVLALTWPCCYVFRLLRLSFAGGDKDESDSDESDEGDIRTNDMKENS